MIRIITDTTSSLPQPLMREMGIDFVPQLIVFGETTYRDDTEIDTITFLEKLKAASSLPKTAAPPPAMYEPIYSRYQAQGDTMIVITPSAELSGTYRSATTAAQDFPDADIRIIDSRTIAGGLGSLALQAHQWAQAGMDADTLEHNVREMAGRERVYFLVDTLEYLHKGGRIGGAKMLVGSLLQVKPILSIRAGRTEPVESQRTKRRAIGRLCEMVLAACPSCPEAYLSIAQAGAYEEARNLASALGDCLGIADVPIYEAPPAIVTHGGPGILAVSFFCAQNAEAKRPTLSNN